MMTALIAGMAMDVQLWMAQIFQGVPIWWQSLGDDARLYVWLAAGIIGVATWAGLAYAILRRLAGQRKFQGRWYNETEYARLMQVLWEDQQSGARVMSRIELKALREFKYGDAVKPILTGKGGGYFDV
jgi:hypothetical protein